MSILPATGPWIHPNQLTFSRLGLCLVFVLVTSVSWSYAATLGLVVFVVASLTDLFDGMLARRWNLITDLGRLMDPLADKVLTSAALITLIQQQQLAPWMVIVIISREFLITGLRLLAASKGQVLSAERAGKHKTITQMTAIISAYVELSLIELGFGNSWLATVLYYAVPLLFWLAVAITLISGAYYLYKNRILFKTPEPAEVISSRVEPVTQSSETLKAPAFKEWHCIVESLGQGKGVLILRKGGIAEGREGFQPIHSRFALFPTAYHQQLEKTKPAATSFACDIKNENTEVIIQYIAESVEARYLSTWDEVARLDSEHLWREEILRERFQYGGVEGLHALVVRVSRLKEPVVLKWSKAFEGCKSWVEVPIDIQQPTEPVLSDQDFAEARKRLWG